jgi:nicotinamidase/pyrazinamidase
MLDRRQVLAMLGTTALATLAPSALLAAASIKRMTHPRCS